MSFNGTYHRFEFEADSTQCRRCGDSLSARAHTYQNQPFQDQAAVAVRAVELLQAENSQLRAEIVFLRTQAVKMRLQIRTAADGLPLLGGRGE